jgi:hypothetical protein
VQQLLHWAVQLQGQVKRNVLLLGLGMTVLDLGCCKQQDVPVMVHGWGQE